MNALHRQSPYVLGLAPVLIAIVLPLALPAQTLSGTVMSGGTPVGDAVVTVWDASSELGRGTTDVRGRFTIHIHPQHARVRVSVRCIGYSPASTLVDALAKNVVIALSAQAIALPALTVTSMMGRCPNRNDIEATALFARVRSQYVVVPANRGVAALMRRFQGRVSEGQVGYFDEAKAVPDVAGVAGVVRAQTEHQIERAGYAAPIAGAPWALAAAARTDGTSRHWVYPSLDRWDVDHWIGNTFQARHTFSAQKQPDGSTDVYFCAREERVNDIQGVLHISRDSTLSSVGWRFVTQRPDEDAGGEVTLLSLTDSVGLRLVPIMSVFWRKDGVNESAYYQDAATYDAFKYGIDSTIPQIKAAVPQ